MLPRPFSSLLPRRAVRSLVAPGLLIMLAACGVPATTVHQVAVAPTGTAPQPTATIQLAPPTTRIVTPTIMPASPIAEPEQTADPVLARAQVPILCYHHIRDWVRTDTPQDRDYIVPVAAFAAQMDWLDQQGYHPINPDQLYAYLTTGAALPPRPILITFDDADASQWTNALPVLQKHHFTATFFVMTVVLDKLNYLSTQQVKALDAMGMTIGAHTYDHQRVTRYSGDDWNTQIVAPTKELAKITRHPIKYFGYPYGLWNAAATPHLKDSGFLAAFQLSDKLHDTAPLYTIRRIVVPGAWTIKQFERAITTRF